jgi:phosphoglycerate dehydrogenase-like enzyme
MLRCAILDDYQNVALALADWGKLAGRVEPRAFNEYVADREQLVDMLADAEIIVAMRERTRIDRALIERLPRLKLLVTTGMKNAAIDVRAAADRGIIVCGTGSSPGATAELAWGLILAHLRHIPREMAEFSRGGRWQLTVGRELAGKRLGVIGLGKLGSRVARAGLAFEMKVAAWSSNLTRERCAEAGVEFAGSLDSLLRESDVVTIHLVLSERTRDLIGARELGLMKPTAILINTSRGPIVNEQALIAALREKKISGAGLDVFGEEPLPADHPLRALDNVVATPHLGYVTEENYRVYYGQAVEDIAAWLDGKPVRVIAPET